MANATAFQDNTAITARQADYPVGTDFVAGANKGGPNCPGLGIDISSVASQPLIESADSWTLDDQWEAARVPQDGAYIGNTGLGDGAEGLGTAPILVVAPDDTDPADIGSGLSVIVGQATLNTLGAGWTI
jgi:hypothetical protein